MFGMQGATSGVNLIQKTASFGAKTQSNPVSKPYISIIDKTFDFLPRLFTITTQNGKYKFNTELLSDSSKTISSQLESDPNNLEFFLDIKDDKNTMKKFECIFYGLSQTFEFDELHTIRQIVKLLRIDYCPIYFKPDINNVYSIPSKIEIEIERNSLQNFLHSKFQDTFTINTNNSIYQCSKLGVISSKIIRELKEANPDMNEYKFDFDDENGEFEDVCKLFNFQIVKITVDNMDSLKQISDELKIEPIMNSIDNFVNVYEKSVQQIDDKKVIIDIIDDISNLLHNIQTLSVESVKKSILNSIWVKKEENVQELAAYILQAVRIGYKLHTYLIDLIISLDESADDDNNKLSILLPYLINILKYSFQTTSFYSSFYLRMAQRGIVEMEDVLNDAMKIITYTPKEGQLREYWNKDIVNILKWFLPELFEKNKNNIDFYNIQIDSDSAAFFKKFLPSNIDEYKNMRDSGMPLDGISKAIYTDDVDTLQSIISKHGIDINEAIVPSSIFDVFVYGQQLYTLINYSVMHGSVKCFKYLLLNHAEMNDLTFVLSIYGGNTEIIRSVNQSAPYILHSNAINVNRGFNNNNNNQYYSFSSTANGSYYYSNFNDIYSYNNNYLSNILAPAIMNHQNDLFDWIFENKPDEIKSTPILDIAYIAVQNGNAHALIQCIDKGLDIHSNSNVFLMSILMEACHEGFYRILQLIVSLCGDNFQINNNQFDQIFYSGNEAIYNLLKSKFFNIQNGINIYRILYPFKLNYNKLVMKIIEDNLLTLNNCNAVNVFRIIFKIVIQNKNIVIFNFLRDKFTFNRITNIYNSFNNSFFDIFTILNKCCKYGFFEAVKEVTEFILSVNPLADFTTSFYYAILANHKEISNYFLDKNVQISIKQSDQKLYSIAQIDNDMYLKLLDKIDPNSKEDVLNEIFNFAVMEGNENLVKLLINKSRLNYLTLINAVQSSNLNIVNMILDIKSDPAFINVVQKNGSALNVAVQNNNIKIVKRLLSIPFINTTNYDSNDCTPLMTAICNFNNEMVDLFVQFYGDKIGSQIWQMNKGIQNILKLLSKNDEKNQRKKKKKHDDDEYDDEDEESNLTKVSLIDTKSTFKLNKVKMLNTISKLAEFENVDLNCHFSSYSLLSYACEINDLELFDLLIKSNKVDVNSYSPINGNTPLIAAVLNNNIQIAQLLIENNQTDINHRNFVGQTALTIAASKENIEIVQILINDEKFDIELSQFYDAYFRSSAKVNKVLLNVKDFNYNRNMKIQNYIELFTDLFVNDNEDDINNKNIIFSVNFSNYLKITFITPLIKAIFEQQNEIIDKIVSQPSFDKEKSHFIDAIFASIYVDDIEIFKKLILLFGNDVNLTRYDGNSLLWFSIFMRTNEITNEILNHNSFDSKKSNIVSAFLKAGCFITNNMDGTNKKTKQKIANLFGTPKFGLFNNFISGAPRVIGQAGQVLQAGPAGGFGAMHAAGFGGGHGGGFQALINQMDNLCDFDENHDNLIKFNEVLPSGKTFFTSIRPNIQNVGEVVDFLIRHGADPNLPDSNGVYPFEYACSSSIFFIIQSMMNLDNIDLSIKSSGICLNTNKDDTALHMLINANNINLFNDVLNRPNLDIINKENELGDTPLLAACKQAKCSFIMRLFSKDNLDYKHRNKEGKDALDILKISINPYNKGQFKNSRNFNWGNNHFTKLEPDDIKSEEMREYYKEILELL